MIKKLIVIFIILSYSLLFVGCWNYTEIDKYSIVAGLAIDKGENGYRYTLSAEIINITGGDKTEIKPKIVQVNTNTIFDGIRDMVGLTSKKLFFAHCKIIIISEQVAKDGIADIMELITRDHETRITMDVVVSKEKTAREILQCKPISTPIVSYEIISILNQNAKFLAEAPKKQVYKVVSEINSKSQSLVLPCFEIEKKDMDEFYRLSGTAVFKKDKLVDYLDRYESKMYLFLTGEVKGALVELNINDKDYIGFECQECKSTIKSSIKDGIPIFNVVINSIFTLGELEIEDESLVYGVEKEKEFKELLEKSMKKSADDLIEKMQKEVGSDIFGFGTSLAIEHKEEWRKYKDNWNDKFKNAQINVQVNVHIRGTGSTNTSFKKGEK